MNILNQPSSAKPQRLAKQLLQRILLVTLAIGVVVASVFFITAALVAGAFLALVLGLRWWWIMRRLRARAKATEPLEGEYRVIPAPRISARSHDH